MTNPQREALFAKGRKLLDTCAEDRDYACVLGYLHHNLGQGGWRAETARKFIAWLRELSQQGGVDQQHAAAILQKMEEL
ncbi:MAG: hypothetical protein ACREOO_29645 [bacterium]